MRQGLHAFTLDAGMVKLVDTPDLGSGAARRGSSSLSTRTRLPSGAVRDGPGDDPAAVITVLPGRNA